MRTPRHFTFIPRLAMITSVSLLCFTASDGSAGTYRNSSHGGLNGAGTGVVRASISANAGNCSHCHEEHASINGSEPAPVAGPSKYLLLNDLDATAGNAACNYCHDSSASPPEDNIASQITKTYKHDPFSGKVTAPATLLCNDCHDSHLAQNVNHVEATGNNVVAATSPLLGVAGVSVTGVWPAPGNPAPGGDANLAPGTPAVANLIPIDPITMEYQLCFKCHGGQANYSLLANLLGQFNPANYSVHPVATEGQAWKNGFLWTNFAAVMNGNWSANRDAEMYCSDCHGSETGTDPKGPHGSTIGYMLKAGNTLTGNYDLLCLRCHKDPALPGMSFWVDIWNTGIVGDHNYAAHQSTVTNLLGTNALGCLACHGDSGNPLVTSNIHGANYMGVVNVPATDTPLPSYTFLVSSLITKHYYNTAFGNNPGGRYCKATCHAADGAAGYIY